MPSSALHQKSSPRFADADMNQSVGYVAMALTIVIWVGFALTTRASSGSALAFGDVALIRAIVPTLVFLPFVPSRLPMIRKAGLRRCAFIFFGAGLPFFALAVSGGAVTSATYVGTLIPGTVPMFVAALIWANTGQRPTKQGVFALALILGGVLWMISRQNNGAALAGGAALLLASLMWATYTFAIKGSGLDPIACAIVIAVPSLAVTGLLVGAGVITTNWGAFSLTQALPFVLVQGIGVGVIASLTYTFAVSRLGPAKCATLGASTPVLTALSAVPLLGEVLSISMGLAALVICAGVVLFNHS